MIFFLPLIALTVANPCPYCKWGSCAFTDGYLANCSACYDLAALVPLRIPASDDKPALFPVGVCRLCPEHCSSCQYALMSANESYAIPAINCTRCVDGYVNSYFNGSCLACPTYCLKCECILFTCAITSCITCADGYHIFQQVIYTPRLRIAFNLCYPNQRRLHYLPASQDVEEEYNDINLRVFLAVLAYFAALSIMIIVRTLRSSGPKPRNKVTVVSFEQRNPAA